MRRQLGFTLVEIAIVLVVIGLLLGGVLKGQELVLNSKIRNAINEYNNVASAMFAYQDRYRQIPGDDRAANARWNTAPVSATDGNGNGIIEGGNFYNTGRPNPDAAGTETGLFWQHLRMDQLVVGPTDTSAGHQASTALPRNSFDGATGIEDTVLVTILGPAICQSNIDVKPAGIIDTRIDDGVGGTGSLLAAEQIGGAEPDVSDGTAADAYNTAASNRYTLCRQL